MKNSTLIGSAAACLMAAALAAPVWSASLDGMRPVSQLEPVWRTDVTGSRTLVVPLMTLVPGGRAEDVKLSGLSREQAFDFGLRRDEVVSDLMLDLRFTPSPSLAPSGSQLNFYLNGRLQRSVPITASMIGKPSQMTVRLSPKVVESANQLTVEFIGHTPSVCENPADPAIWLDIAAESTLTLVKQRVRLANDLAAFPAPFVDTASNEPVTLPMVFAGAPDSKEKQAAAVLASVVGRMSDWRGADFPVYFGGTPAEGHFVVFATNDRRPDFLKDLPRADGPMVSIADAPASLAGKMLVIRGRNADDLLAAVRALGAERPVMVGETFRVKKAEVPPVREAYDAPRWINSDVEIPFSKLMQYPGQLSARGYVMAPVQLPVKFAPDLFMVGDSELGMKVRYRYAKPMTGETAQFRAYINGFLVDSDTLAGKDGRGMRSVQLPSYYGPISADDPQGASLTHLTNLGFGVSYERMIDGGSQENCRSVSLIGHQMEVEPSSSLMLKGLYHHAELPDLKLFTRSGYPFTKYADLSQTAVFIPQDARRSEITTMLNTVGRMSAMTGVAAMHVHVTGDASDPELAKRDILAFVSFPETMADIDSESAATVQLKLVEQFKARKPELQSTASGVHDEDLAAIVSAESPFSSGRTLVALMSENDSGAARLNAELVNPAGLGTASGSVSVLNAAGVTGFDVGGRYTVGNLPWYQMVWMRVVDRPGVLVAAALLSALLVGLGIFLFMRYWIRNRS